MGSKGLLWNCYCSLNREICFLRHSSSFEFTKRKVMTNINNKRKIIYEDKTLVLSSFDKESGSAWKRIEKHFFNLPWLDTLGGRWSLVPSFQLTPTLHSVSKKSNLRSLKVLIFWIERLQKGSANFEVIWLANRATLVHTFVIALFYHF